jgi:hypothetical protein
MNDDILMLITLTDGERILKVALKSNPRIIDNDVAEYWGEPENKLKIHSLLPLHVRSFGKIVECERLFEITDSTQYQSLPQNSTEPVADNR